MGAKYLIKLVLITFIFSFSSNKTNENKKNELNSNNEQYIDSLINEKLLVHDDGSVKLYIQDTVKVKSSFVYVQCCLKNKYSYYIVGKADYKVDKYYIYEFYLEYSGGIIKDRTYNPNLFCISFNFNKLKKKKYYSCKKKLNNVLKYW